MIYEGKNITKDISDCYSSISYTDYLSGMADEISVSLENRDGRWFRGWMPQKADKVRLYIGYEGKPLLNCGIFILDEISYSGFPDVIELKGSSFPFSPDTLHKTKKRRVFENRILSSIVSQIAQENGLQQIVDIQPDIQIKRIDQIDQTDATFLTNLAKQYGYYIKFAENKLIFSKYLKLEQMSASETIHKDELISYSIKDTTHTLYKKAIVRYFDHKEQRFKKYTFEDPNVRWGDTLKLSTQVNSLEEAQEKAKAALRANNSLSTKISLELNGNPAFVAGMTVNIEGFGNYDGKYIIDSSTHTLDSSGYETSLELRKCLNY